jgi:hypothetical protein
MAGLTIFAVLLVALALATIRYGADTRTADSWTPGRGEPEAPRARASVRSDLAALLRAIRRVHIPRRRSAHVSCG